jgi:REP element-mobilizing transposase RayT
MIYNDQNKKSPKSRNSIRLKNHDYSQNGLYFITICTQNRINLFGEIINDVMQLNDAGKNAHTCWKNIPKHYPDVKLHEFIIMPNHIHGIIEITIGAEYFPPKKERLLPTSLGNIIKGYKIGVTKWFQKNKNQKRGQTIWQRNYWEHIVRDEKDYNNISEYIINNPLSWNLDSLNQNNCTDIPTSNS